MTISLIRSATAAAVAVVLLVVASSCSWADERILDFTSGITIATDGELTVRETIQVRAEGNRIKRGIYRDIPLIFEGADGRIRRAGFELVSVERDGRPEPYHVNTSDDGVRIYIGEADVFLASGVYTYTIIYHTTRQIRFFDAHDELYWNATGNEWVFPIDRANATVALPPRSKPLKHTAYTGPYGSRENATTAQVDASGGTVRFSATRVLGPGEGMTIVVALPKGAISAPTAADEARYFLLDHRGELLGGFGLLLVLFYYLIAWWQVGRDPPKGVIFPRFEPPAEISPALANYVWNKGFKRGGWPALSAACINLAVKGCLHLKDLEDGLRLVRVDSPKAIPEKALPKGERAIFTWLKKHNKTLKVNKENGSAVVKLGTAFRSAIETENRNKYFKKNWLYLVPGAVLTILTVLVILIFGGLREDDLALFIPIVSLGIIVTVVAVAIGESYRGGLSLLRKGDIGARIGIIFAVFGAGIALVVGLGVVGAIFAGAMEGVHGSPILPGVAAALISTNVLFYFLIGAPTALGRQALDEIEGLKLYLTVAEKERMNMEGAPKMSPAHYETLLPYAVALDVEKPWSQAFQDWLISSIGARDAENYRPTWYAGDAFGRQSFSASMHEMTSSMSDSFVSSMPAPKSSSSGFSSGGGFSGGGGGGGGGGGW